MSLPLQAQRDLENVAESLNELKASDAQVSMFSHLCNVNKETRELWPDRVVGRVNMRTLDVEEWARVQARWDMRIIIDLFVDGQVEYAIKQIKHLLK